MHAVQEPFRPAYQSGLPSANGENWANWPNRAKLRTVPAVTAR